MRKTKILCTMGPACDSVATLQQMIEAGMNMARLNMAHGDLDEHRRRIATVRQAAELAGVNIPILMDIKGPEIRIGQLQEPSYELQIGDKLILTTEQIVGDARRVSVSYAELTQDVTPGALILIDDGSIELKVEAVDGRNVHCQVLNASQLKPRKGVNLPGIHTSLPGVTERDVMHLRFAAEENVDIIAMSFVRNGDDVRTVRGLLESFGIGHAPIISKIENEEGLSNLASILEASDGIMVARGDLGVEIPCEEVPIAQKTMIEQCNRAGKPVITATQMLDSMQRNPRPTRAEVSDVANAVLDGTDVVMLSGESAAGKYPVESVRMMAQIAERTEGTIDHDQAYRKISQAIAADNVTEIVCQSVVEASLKLNAAAILTPTESGFTARMIAKYRPKSPIIAMSPNKQVLPYLTMMYGITPVLGVKSASTDELIHNSLEDAKSKGHIRENDYAIISAGIPIGQSGSTNLLKIVKI